MPINRLVLSPRSLSSDLEDDHHQWQPSPPPLSTQSTVWLRESALHCVPDPTIGNSQWIGHHCLPSCPPPSGVHKCSFTKSSVNTSPLITTISLQCTTVHGCWTPTITLANIPFLWHLVDYQQDFAIVHTDLRNWANNQQCATLDQKCHIRDRSRCSRKLSMVEGRFSKWF